MKKYLPPLHPSIFVPLVFPAVASAQVTNIWNMFTLILQLVRGLAAFLGTLAIALFLWGVVKFILNAQDAKEREKGKSFMLWGIICIFVLVSIWGLVQFVIGSFGLPGGSPGYVDKNGTML